MIRALFAKLRTIDRAPYAAGWVLLILSFLCVCAAPWDPRLVSGVNPWFKPIKYAISTAIYLWTLGLLLAYLPKTLVSRRVVATGAPALMLFEVACIALQAGRGVGSHFNTDTLADTVIFEGMGIAILLNTLLLFLVLFQYLWHDIDLPRAVLMGARLGMMMFLLGSLEGIIMVLTNAHTIGAPDGGPGLPFLNWSTHHGDLRIAHLVGINSLQILPIVGYFVWRRFADKRITLQLIIVTFTAVALSGLFLSSLRRAAEGIPLLGS